MNAEIITFSGLRAYGIQTPPERDTRKAWKLLTEAITRSVPGWKEPDIGYVFIPQWKWNTGVDRLWVGVDAESVGDLPEGLEEIVIPSCVCAKTVCHGNLEHVRGIYDRFFRWIGGQGYKLDIRKGILGIEANRLQNVNPFEMPMEEVGTFDFDMIYPVIPRQEA